jgi:protease IV
MECKIELINADKQVYVLIFFILLQSNNGFKLLTTNTLINMKDFFKYLLATVIGVLLTGFITMLIFFGIIGAMVSKSDKPVEVKENSVLILKLDKEIVDRASKNPFEGFDPISMSTSQKMGLNDILKAIGNAAEDDKIKGIYIENRSIPAGAATIEEIRDALIKFKASGKFIVAFSDGFSQKSYYLTSIADKILLNPEGMVEWVGLRSEVMFYKNAFEKLGVEPQILRHGKFKSAVEPFMLDKMSPENREQISTYMGSIWNHWVKGISQARNISVEELNAFADGMVIRSATTSLENGLVDSVVYKDQVLDYLKGLTGIELKKDLNAVEIAKYIKVPGKKKHKGLAKDKIAVIYASGQIVDGEGGAGEVGGDNFGRAIRQARRDSTIKAIVLRINSPGGSALASEIIWREVGLAKQVKPVVVSMGDVAASGGYYIAVPADTILVSPTTITGSIGVFGMFFNVQEGMNKKLGLNVETVKTNKYSDFGTMYRPMTAEERVVGQQLIEDIYKTFIGHVAEGRKMDVEQVDNVGQGRVWSGSNALDIKLVDGYAGLERAIEIAAQRAGIEKYRVTELPKAEDPFQALIKDLTGSARAWLIGGEMMDAYKPYEQMLNMVKNQGVQARLPYEIEIY